MDSIFKAMDWSMSVLIFIIAFMLFMFMDREVEKRYTYMLNHSCYSEIAKQ